MRIARIGLVAVLAAFAAACTAGWPWASMEAREELQRNRRLWELSATADYRFTAQRECFCAQEVVSPVVVEVRDGEVSARRVAASGEPVNPAHAHLWPSVDDLFDLIQDAIDRGADSVSVRYDPGLGYPVRIRIDFESRAVDEELGFTVTEFGRR